MKKFLLLFAGLTLMAGFALAANPCTVGPTGDFATIAAAIDSWCPGGSNAGETAPLVINIDPSVEYDEVLSLDTVRTTSPRGDIVGDLVIQSATPGTPVVLKVQYDPRMALAAGARDGLYVYQEQFDVTFNDILFTPSASGTAIDDDLVKVDENPITTATIPNIITFDRCVFTDSFTSGTTRVPKVKSKADLLAMNFPADMTAFTPAGSMAAGDDLLKWWGDAGERMDLMVKDCVFFTKNGRCLEAVTEGENETVTIIDSLFAMGAASYVVTARPYNANCVVNVLGTKDPRQGDLTKCTAILNARAHSLYTSGGGAPPIGVTNIKNVLVNMYNDTGTAARPISGGAEGKLVEDSIFFVDRYPGNIVDYALIQDSVYNRCTFHRPTASGLTAQSMFYLGSASDPFGIYMTDCVISGANMPNICTAGGLDVGGFNLINCAIATEGPDAITTTGIAVTMTDCKFVDPMYVSYNVKDETFLDTSNPALALAATDGTGIGGGAHFRPPDASDDVVGALPNIFKDFGDCENDIFRVASGRSDWGDPLDGYGPGTEGDIYSVQDPIRGVVGNCAWIHHPSGRLEAGTGIGTFPGPITYSPLVYTAPGAFQNTDGGTDLVWSFYYKMPTIYSSYPRLAVRINPLAPPFSAVQGQIGDCAVYKELIAPGAWTVDSNWHLKVEPLTTLNFDARTSVNMFVNNYLVPNWYLDEIYLIDPSVPTLTSVQDWGLF
ncbi:hypothetical protein JW926_13175 [Candidatus Sumerlaeota bacterium]|nr:hypothetical protein [Candidatus Sumerlaeota bacterium]